MVCMNYVYHITETSIVFFFIFDEGQIVVLFNCFQKKTQKTPETEIDKALKIKEEYYEYKKQHAD